MEEGLHLVGDVVQGHRLSTGTLPEQSYRVWITAKRVDVGFDPGDGQALIEYTVVALEIVRTRASGEESKDTLMMEVCSKCASRWFLPSRY